MDFDDATMLERFARYLREVSGQSNTEGFCGEDKGKEEGVKLNGEEKADVFVKIYDCNAYKPSTLMTPWPGQSLEISKAWFESIRTITACRVTAFRIISPATEHLKAFFQKKLLSNS